MDHFHKILENTTDHAKPGNQLDTDSFLSARNLEMQALLKEIRKSFKFQQLTLSTSDTIIKSDFL